MSYIKHLKNENKHKIIAILFQLHMRNNDMFLKVKWEQFDSSQHDFSFILTINEKLETCFGEMLSSTRNCILRGLTRIRTKHRYILYSTSVESAQKDSAIQETSQKTQTNEPFAKNLFLGKFDKVRIIYFLSASRNDRLF